MPIAVTWLVAGLIAVIFGIIILIFPRLLNQLMGHFS